MASINLTHLAAAVVVALVAGGIVGMIGAVVCGPVVYLAAGAAE